MHPVLLGPVKLTNATIACYQDTTEVNWTAALPDDPYGVDDVMADLPQPGHKTFTEAIDQLEEGCRQATRKLYEDEGKEALLGEGSVPESLEVSDNSMLCPPIICAW
jgi:hypothetical protein